MCNADERNEVNVNFIDTRCPKCGAPLLSDGTKIHCSFIGAGHNYPACDYGIKEAVYVHPEDK